MRKFFISLLAGILIPLCLLSNLNAQTVKTINVKVIDAANSASIEGATVKLLGTVKQERITGGDGFATFKIYSFNAPKDVEMEVTYGSFPIRKYKTFSAVIQIGSDDTYNIVAPLNSGDLRFTVTVLAQQDGKPLRDVKINIKTPEGNFNGTTDGYGTAVIDFVQSGSYKMVTVQAEKEGYITFNYVVDIDEENSNYPVSLSLPLKKDVKLLKVKVTDEKGEPVQDAAVFARGEAVPDIPKVVTDETGMATIVCKETGTYNVSVQHSNFETGDNKIAINKYAQQDEYYLTFSLNRKADKENNLLRPLKVAVLDEKTRQGVPGAMVTTGEDGALTDKTGVAYFKKVVALGESGRVQVTAKGYAFAETYFIGGGDNYRYSPPSQDEVRFYLKKSRPPAVNLTVQVIDYNTQRPVGKASVTVKNRSGKVLFATKPTNAKGEATAVINGMELDNAPLRVQAKATGYEENWSDLTSDFLNLGNDPVVFTINIKQAKAKAETAEKKYGPFQVTSSEWHSTGITFKKGDYFRIEASGYFTTKDGQKIGPEGGGYWTWWTLAGQVGKQRLSLSRNGGGAAPEDGVLELGTPRGLGSVEFVKEDIENLQGSLTVYVFSKKGAWNNTDIYKQAETDLRFLKRLLNNDPTIIKNRDEWEIAGQYKYIVQKYKLGDLTYKLSGFSFTCSEIIRAAFSDIKPLPDFVKTCLNQTIRDLENKINNKEL